MDARAVFSRWHGLFFFGLIAATLLTLLVLSLMQSIGEAACAAKKAEEVCWEYIFNRYQTLVSAIAAVGAAGVAWIAVQKQVAVADRSADIQLQESLRQRYAKIGDDLEAMQQAARALNGLRSYLTQAVVPAEIAKETFDKVVAAVRAASGRVQRHASSERETREAYDAVVSIQLHAKEVISLLARREMDDGWLETGAEIEKLVNRCRRASQRAADSATYLRDERKNCLERILETERRIAAGNYRKRVL